MRLRRVPAGVAVVLACVMLCSCKKRADEQAAPDQPTQTSAVKTVGFSQIAMNSNWRQAMTQSMRAAAEARGITLIVDDAEARQSKQSGRPE